MTLAAPGAQARATAVQCGQTVTGAVVLDGDLKCSGGGLTLAPGASLDLGGHSLIGSKSGTGITLPENGDARISNGTIRYWAHGMRPAGQFTAHTGTTTVSDLFVLNNDRGIETFTSNVEGGPVLDIDHSTFVGNVHAIKTRYTHLTIRDSYFKAAPRVNGTTSVFGVESVFTDLLISHSIFQSVPTAVFCEEDKACAITTTVMRDGKVGVNTGDRGDGNSVKLWANRFTRLDIGVKVAPSFGVVRIADNRFLQARIGVSATNVPLQLVGNDMQQGVTALRLGVDEDWFRPTDGTIASNTVSGYADGLVVTAPAARAAGIGVQANAANNNANYGINAPGVTDLGGNTASGNGHDPQCVGVVCG